MERHLDPATARTARLFLERIAHNYAVAQAVVFGSRARNTHRADSDADVAVILRGAPQPFVATKLAMADVAFDVMLETGILVQALPVWECEWVSPHTYGNPSLLEKIAVDGIFL
jgi:predicted nucleotidyltransferase